MEPALHEGIVGGFILESERHLRPKSFLRGLEAKLEESGVTLRRNETVVDLVQRRATVAAAATTREIVTADAFVLAAGVWSDQIARTVDRRLPLRPGKGYSVTWESA